MPVSLLSRLKNAARVKVVPQVIPVSITGWNTRDAVTAMDPTDAVILDNWYPDKGGVVSRNGYSTFASGLGSGYVNTIAQYEGMASNKLLAACGATIYDISLGGSGTALKAGFTSSKWQTVNFDNKLFLFNGVDTPQIYDGSSLSDAAFTGVTQAELKGVNVFKSRLFTWRANDDSFWYGDTDAIAGALDNFPLGTVSQSGGYLMTMITMSHDGGNGIEDLAVFIMSSGETLLYAGSDPGDSDNWALVGRYKIAPPVNIRSVVRYGAEAYATTSDDHVPLQQQLVALRLGQVPPRSKASGAVQEAFAEAGGLFGWQAFFYPKGRRLIFNVPNNDGTFFQHIYNLSQNAWCRFTGMNATCWEIFNNDLYFGTNSGSVCLADDGALDNGQPITTDGQPAWAMFDDPRRKRLSAIRPLLSVQGIAQVRFGTGFDYSDITLNSSSTTVNVTGSPWDTSPWDTSPWSSATAQIDGRWRLAGGTGYAVGFRLVATTEAPLTWLRTDCRYEIGRDL